MGAFTLSVHLVLSPFGCSGAGCGHIEGQRAALRCLVDSVRDCCIRFETALHFLLGLIVGVSLFSQDV